MFSRCEGYYGRPKWERREDEETGEQDQQEVAESDNEAVGLGEEEYQEEEGQDVGHNREDVAMGGHQYQETGEQNEGEAVGAEEETDTTEGDTKVTDGEEEDADDEEVDAEVEEGEVAQDEVELDAEVRHFVETGNMEELAALVLNGQGERLVGHSSTDPELQSFLNNVPAYMAKIRAVHEAAKEGRLRDLQASLDRRKFAIARDNSSGLGATPLHVATLFGHTSIVRYLAGRFPETLYAKDNNERTPLHYAATIRDNGHYYNLLLNAGANPTLKDNFKCSNSPFLSLQLPCPINFHQFKCSNSPFLSLQLPCPINFHQFKCSNSLFLSVQLPCPINFHQFKCSNSPFLSV
ncbi:unnamed protein product [Timema podura]|uniref:Uncharacterized protein n=1 Tax=Timema podura TaxID=61482 RepID=A0ABN7P2I6_TIMPD|nr:unnamed protein product [Timema podura]